MGAAMSRAYVCQTAPSRSAGDPWCDSQRRSPVLRTHCRKNGAVFPHYDHDMLHFVWDNMDHPGQSWDDVTTCLPATGSGSGVPILRRQEGSVPYCSLVRERTGAPA